MKSQFGFDTTRVHSIESIENKFAVCFVVSILRSGILIACKKLGYDTNQSIREIDRIVLMLMTDGLYGAVNNQTNRQKELLAEFGIQSDFFKTFADDVNRRMVNPINSQIHQLPAGRAAVPQKRRGRPLKKKVETVESAVPKRSAGRPKGNKNKPKNLRKKTGLGD